MSLLLPKCGIILSHNLINLSSVGKIVANSLQIEHLKLITSITCEYPVLILIP